MGNKQSKKNKNYKIPSDAELPSAPGQPEVLIDGMAVSLRWDPPAFDGGCPIIGYTIQHLELEGSEDWLNSNPVLYCECLLQNLIPGITYQFRIVAENILGYSTPSDPSPSFLFNPTGLEEFQPRFFRELENSLNVLENEKVELSVEISGQPFPSVEWFLNNTPIQPDSRINFSSSGSKKTLIFRQIRTSDSGQIKCAISSYLGSTESNCQIIVESPPHVKPNKKYEQGLIYQSGQVIRLKFYFTASPNSIINWTHDGNLIDSKNYEICQDSSTLKIMNAKREDRGEYMIKIANDLGEDSASVLITVTDKPSPPSKPQIVQLSDNSCVLNWNSAMDDGGSQINSYLVEYFRDGWSVWLKSLSCRETMCKIKDLIAGSKYRFRVKAENLYGLSEPSEESVEIFIPDPSQRAGGLMTVLKEHPSECEEESLVAEEAEEHAEEILIVAQITSKSQEKVDKIDKIVENVKDMLKREVPKLPLLAPVVPVPMSKVIDKKSEEIIVKSIKNLPQLVLNKNTIAPLADIDDELSQPLVMSPKSPKSPSESTFTNTSSSPWTKSSFKPSFKPKYSINSPPSSQSNIAKLDVTVTSPSPTAVIPQLDLTPPSPKSKFDFDFKSSTIPSVSSKKEPKNTAEDTDLDHEYENFLRSRSQARSRSKVIGNSSEDLHQTGLKSTTNSTSTPNIFDHYYIPPSNVGKKLFSSTSELTKTHKDNPHNKSYFIMEDLDDDAEDDSSLILTTSSLTLPLGHTGQCKITRSDQSLDDLSSNSPRPSVSSPPPPGLGIVDEELHNDINQNLQNYGSSRSRASFLHTSDVLNDHNQQQQKEDKSAKLLHKISNNESCETYDDQEDPFGSYEEGYEGYDEIDRDYTDYETVENMAGSSSGEVISTRLGTNTTHWLLSTMVYTSIVIFLCPLFFLNIYLTLFSLIAILFYLLRR